MKTKIIKNSLSIIINENLLFVIFCTKFFFPCPESLLTKEPTLKDYSLPPHHQQQYHRQFTINHSSHAQLYYNQQAQTNINYHHKYSIEMMNVGGDIVGLSPNVAVGNPVTAGVVASEQQQQQQMLRSSSPGQSKMTDILKRKVPPKRKSQTSSRSKSRNQDHHSEQSSSVMQELINKATALGKHTF